MNVSIFMYDYFHPSFAPAGFDSSQPHLADCLLTPSPSQWHLHPTATLICRFSQC